MWLFDELLPKSNSSQSANPGSGGTQQDPSSGSTGQPQDPLAEPIITISESASIATTPAESTTEPVIEITPDASPVEVEKIAEDTSILVTQESSVAKQSDENITDLLDIQEDTIAFLKTDEKKNDEISIDAMVNSDLLNSESLFENIKETQDKDQDELFSVMSKTEGSIENATENTTTPKSFKEYIQSAIASATTLLKNLAKQDEEKLAKEHEYEEQQVHFAELAKQAEEEHKKILAEKEQAEKMIAYLEEEKKHADENGDMTVENTETWKTNNKKTSKKEIPEELSESKENISLI